MARAAANLSWSPKTIRVCAASSWRGWRRPVTGFWRLQTARMRSPCSKKTPDIALILTDIAMPGGMTGDELAERARLLRPDVRILFTSGYASPQIAEGEMSNDASWLKKPYTARELAVRLRELLD